MKAQDYLKNLIEKCEYELSPEDKKKLQTEGMAAYIIGKLTSSKYKASSTPEELLAKVRSKVDYCIAKNIPIHITIPFGGYKKWQLPSAPEVDWSEVFNMLQLRNYLLPIAAAYKPGVIMEYFSDEIFVSRMNNIDQKDLDLYNEQIALLTKLIGQYLPDNFTLKFSKIRDFISQAEILQKFDVIIDRLKQGWDQVPEEQKQIRLGKAERNYKGDLSKLAAEERAKILWESALVHDAFVFGDWDQNIPWAFAEDMIAVGFRYTGDWGVHLRSSRSSTLQFWVGTGALLQRQDEYIPTILSYEQYLQNKDKLQYEKVKIFPKSFSNLQQVPCMKK